MRKHKTALMAFAARLPAAGIGQWAAADEMTSYSPVTQQRLENPEAGNWLLYRRTYDGHGFSPLRQINTDNVKDLVPVWTFCHRASWRVTRRRRW